MHILGLTAYFPAIYSHSGLPGDPIGGTAMTIKIIGLVVLALVMVLTSRGSFTWAQVQGTGIVYPESA